MSDQSNLYTSQAATTQSDALQDPLMLIGIFGTEDEPTVLLRDRTGQISRLPDDSAEPDLRLIDTGEGWALVEDHGTIRRLGFG